MQTFFRLALTAGEPAGVGPDIIVQVAQQTLPAEIVVIGDKTVLSERAQQLKIPLKIREFDSTLPPQPHTPGQLTVWHVPVTTPVIPGKLDTRNALQVVETLRIAVQGALQKQFAAIVTAPVHKAIINQAGIAFSGHTEFFAEVAQIEKPVMLFVINNLRVALVTTHLPLAKVPAAITENAITQTIEIVRQALQQYFQIKNPRIVVSGLNPHAGENGLLGHEEIELIIPTLEKLRKQNWQIEGPLPADTLFLPEKIAQTDAFISMYHDQSLPFVKAQGFDQAVNVTLGLPFIRTSVDHGTALSLAGTGHARSENLYQAIITAISFLNNH